MTRILIADDDELSRLVIGHYLTKAGYLVETAVDGLDALKKTAAFKPELLVLDLNMPKMSGFDVARRLKENPETRNIPIFVITTYGQEINIKKGYALGIEEYITKPLNMEHLKLRINKYLKKDRG